jgi:hypothetical protein
MKKIVFLLVAVVSLMAAQAQQHVEFKWHRMYGVAGYEFSSNINAIHFDLDEGANLEYGTKATMHGIYAICGWQIRKESGIGLGVEFLKDFAGGLTQLPVFVEVRSHYLRSPLTHYTSAYVGYSIPLGFYGTGAAYTKIEAGGPTFGLNVGGRYAFNRKMGVSAFIGYQLITLRKVGLYADGVLHITQPVTMHNFKAGVGFNF